MHLDFIKLLMLILPIRKCLHMFRKAAFARKVVNQFLIDVTKTICTEIKIYNSICCKIRTDHPVEVLTNFPGVLSSLMEKHVSVLQEHFLKRLEELKHKWKHCWELFIRKRKSYSRCILNFQMFILFQCTLYWIGNMQHICSQSCILQIRTWF